jgi:hypothetical protein
MALNANGTSFLLPSLHTLYNFIFCILASNALVNKPIYGGALYLAGQVASLAVKYLFNKNYRSIIGEKAKIVLYILTCISFLVSLTLIIIYPKAVGIENLWITFGLVLATTLRSLVFSRMMSSPIAYKMSLVQKRIRLIELNLLFTIIVTALVFSTQSSETAWYLLGAYVISSLMEGFSLRSGKTYPFPKPQTISQAAIKQAEGISSYHVFLNMLALCISAIQITMILIYSFIATSAHTVFFSLLVTHATQLIIVQAIRFILAQKNIKDYGNLLLFGLILWILSLIIFWKQLYKPEHIWRYLSLVSCSAGVMLSLVALSKINNGMSEVLLFALDSDTAYKTQQATPIIISYSTLQGQMLALIGLTIIAFLENGSSINPAAWQPALILPALVLAALAILTTLRFPLTKHHMQKLHNYLMLTKSGETNIPLQKQLEEVIIRANRRRYGLRLLGRFISLFLGVQVVGSEKVPEEDGISNVFICNHCEVYGPISCYIYMPFQFRPWITNQMMDKTQTVKHIYEGTFLRQEWMPDSWKLPLSKMLAPIINWAMHSADGIPVYKNSPKKLIRTFRETVSYMQAGDNILIFPENPLSEENSLYLKSGVSEFFDGFVLVAPLYHQKTDKACRFIPMYADSKRRRLSFGDYITYNHENDFEDEKKRICTTLRQEMLRLAEVDE